MRADWREDALCAGENPELWFSPSGMSRDTRKAISICLRCPVRAPCADFAEASQSDYGVWGGRGAVERRTVPGRPRRGTGNRRAGRPEHGDDAGAQRHRRRGEAPCRECLAGERAASVQREANRRRRRSKAA